MTAADAGRVSDEDRARALIVQVHSGWCIAFPGQPNPDGDPCHCRAAGVADAIAAALVAERARAVADLHAAVEAALVEFSALSHLHDVPRAETWAQAAARLRAVLDATGEQP